MENIERGTKYIRRRPPFSIPRSTGGIMPCRSRGWGGSGGIVSCVEIDYHPTFDTKILEKIKEKMNEEITFRNFRDFYNINY